MRFDFLLIITYYKSYNLIIFAMHYSINYVIVFSKLLIFNIFSGL